MTNYYKLLTGLCLSASIYAQAQVTNFALFPNKVNVTTTTTSSTNLGGALNSTSNYEGGNAVFDENNNLVFAIREGEVFNSAGNLVGELPGYRPADCMDEFCASSYEYTVPSSEIVIVPIPDACSKYKVFYVNYSRYGTALLDVTIDASNGVTILAPPSNYMPINQSGGNEAKIAISKSLTDGSRYLYHKIIYSGRIRESEVLRYTISNIGTVSSGTFVKLVPSSSFNKTTEMDLTPDGTQLYWGDEHKLYVMDVSGNTFTAPLVGTLPSSNVRIYGVEFYNNKYYLATSDGLKTATLTNGAFVLANTSILGVINSDLEVGNNGLLYGVNNSGKLFSVNTSGALVTTAISVYNTTSFGTYKLNDQIDGEDYTYFNGTPFLAMDDMEINGIEIENRNDDDIFTAYNCNDMEFTMNSNGSSSYILLISDHTDALGNFQKSGSTQVYRSGYINGDIPTTIDLKNLPGTDGDYLDNHFGYFRFVAIAHNRCEYLGRDIYINVPSNPSPATVDVKLNQPNGTPVDMTETLPGQSMGIFSGSYNISQSTGAIDFHTIAIDEVNALTGAVTNVVFPKETITIGSVSTLTALPFNALDIPASTGLNWGGGAGYFATNSTSWYKSYKVTVGVGNVCNTSEEWSYITPDQFARVASTDFGENDTQSAYPNPFTEETTITFDLQEYEVLSDFELFDSKGIKVATDYEIASDNGTGTVYMIGTSLDTGLYVYRCKTNQGTISGKIMKK